MQKLYSRSYGGNSHATVVAINKEGLAEYVLSVESTGLNTVVIFKMQAEMVHRLRRDDRSFCGEPDFDDPKVLDHKLNNRSNNNVTQ